MMCNSARSKLLEFFRSGGVAKTRLRETTEGVVEYLQHGIWDIPCNLKMPESELIALIWQLEFDGQVEFSEVVSIYDPSEYLIQWRRKN